MSRPGSCEARARRPRAPRPSRSPKACASTSRKASQSSSASGRTGPRLLRCSWLRAYQSGTDGGPAAILSDRPSTGCVTVGTVLPMSAASPSRRRGRGGPRSGGAPRPTSGATCCTPTGSRCSCSEPVRRRARRALFTDEPGAGSRCRCSRWSCWPAASCSACAACSCSTSSSRRSWCSRSCGCTPTCRPAPSWSSPPPRRSCTCSRAAAAGWACRGPAATRCWSTCATG